MEIHRLDFENDFKWQADDSDHHRVCVEGKFRRNLVFYGLGADAFPFSVSQKQPDGLH